MASGSLRNPVIIDKKIVTRNSYGEEVVTMTPYISTWAEIKPIKASEYFEAGTVNHRVSHRIIIRYDSGIRPDMQVIFMGRVFEIKGVRNFFERDKYLELMCEEVQND